MSAASNVRHVDTIHGSMRAYMDANTWRTFNGTYGVGYHQMSSAAGTGANPAPSANNRNGYIISKDKILEEVRLQVRRNNTEAVNWEYDIYVMRGGNIHPDT